MNISSAISVTRNSTSFRTLTDEYAYNYQDFNTSERYILHLNEDQTEVINEEMLLDEKALDLNCFFQQTINNQHSNINLSSLPFSITNHDNSRILDNTLGNMLRNDKSYYYVNKRNLPSFAFKFTGWSNYHDYLSCTLSYVIVILENYNGGIEGMVATSNEPINIEDIKTYGSRVEFKSMSNTIAVINMNDRICKQVLLKLNNSSNCNFCIRYVGFIGYTGSRCFASGILC